MHLVLDVNEEADGNQEGIKKKQTVSYLQSNQNSRHGDNHSQHWYSS